MPQLTLPPETEYLPIELAFIEDSPPGLWPENQNSNFGQVRRTLCELFTDVAEQHELIFNEHFLNTVTVYLDEWEREMLLPVAPTGKPFTTRVSDVLSRFQRGPFTRAGRKSIVERYVVATFGTSVGITPEGIELTVAGVALPADAGAVDDLYQITENITGFSYLVQIINTVTPDIPSLTRELELYTPAGISFTIDNTWTG